MVFGLQYLAAGRGPAIVLLHGYTETSRMWRPVMPRLAQAFTVIAPDLPGIGGFGIPEDGVDMTRAAVRIHKLVKSLGIDKAVVVGHDIGLMVVYGYAAQFPDETNKLVLMDAFLPGVEGWEAIYNSPALWHFRFHGPAPEALVSGRERTYFDYYWNEFAAERTRSLPEADRRAYAAAYARPGRMRAPWAYFASFPLTATDFARLSQTPLTMPVLSIGGAKANGDALGQQVKRIASNATVITLPDTGHWLMEERPGETADALVRFVTTNPTSPGYISSMGRTSDSHSNSGQWTRCNSMNSRATASASSFDFVSTSANPPMTSLVSANGPSITLQLAAARPDPVSLCGRLEPAGVFEDSPSEHPADELAHGVHERLGRRSVRRVRHV